MIWKLPLDIPLVTPTLGLPLFIYDALLVIVFVVHIVFIYTLLGAALASVIYNIMGVTKKSKDHDELAYRLTNFTTISENMGALWGVAPLLIIGVLYTGFIYTTVIKISPHILHIIYGNIVAFFISYAYKFSWHNLKEHKGFHIAMGIAMVTLFFTLPFIFMSMTNLYMQPELFGTVQNIWGIMLTPLTGIRLVNFFLTAFSFFGVVLIFFSRGWTTPEDAKIREIALDQGRKWVIFTAPLNIVILPLVLFAYSPRIAENFIHTPFVLLPFFAAAILFFMVLYFVKEFNSKDMSKAAVWSVLAAMVTVVLLMSTARQGLRVASFTEPMKLQQEETKKYMDATLAAYQEYKAEQRNKPAVDSDPARALAEQKGCLACHSIEMQLVGPAYKEVAKKYSSADEVIPSILKGSTGKWPAVNGAAMPPNNVTEDEARILAEWVLKQK
jgi:cytochrome c